LYRLGFVDEPVPGHESYRDRLSIPYLTRTGVVALTFRCIEDHSCKEAGHSKYLKPPAVSSRLYNTTALFTDQPFIAIAEGELDALTLSISDIPAVGVPGATNWRRYYNRCFEDFTQVYVFCDGDTAGREFGKKVAHEIEYATLIHLPEGEDVNSLYCKEGKEALWSLTGLTNTSYVTPAKRTTFPKSTYPEPSSPWASSHSVVSVGAPQEQVWF